MIDHINGQLDLIFGKEDFVEVHQYLAIVNFDLHLHVGDLAGQLAVGGSLAFGLRVSP